MIHNIVFDMGGVLIHWEPRLLTQRFQLSEREESLLRQETFERSEWEMLDQGTISVAEAIKGISSRLPEKLRPYVTRLVSGWWELALEPMEGMAELLEELKGRGYGLYVLSNAAVTLRQYFDTIPGAACFDGIYVSAEHGLLKPQREIYRDFLDMFSLSADSCLFIDDRAENIAGAANVGIHGIVFSGSTSKLREHLQGAAIM